MRLPTDSAHAGPGGPAQPEACTGDLLRDLLQGQGDLVADFAVHDDRNLDCGRSRKVIGDVEFRRHEADLSTEGAGPNRIESGVARLDLELVLQLEVGAGGESVEGRA